MMNSDSHSNKAKQLSQLTNQTKKQPESFHPFHMRTRNLDKFRNEAPSYRLSHHKNVMNRAKIGCLTSTSKSLDILRACLQESLNQEIDHLMQRYLQQYFKPAIDNIRRNNGEHSVSEYHVQAVFRQVLEEAKKMYYSPESTARITTPTLTMNASGLVSKRKRLNSANRRENENNFNVVNSRKQFAKRLSTSEMEKKKIKQNESREIRKAMLKKRKLGTGQAVTRGRPPLGNGKSKLIDLGEDNWNKDRITAETRFVLGSKANRALGFGSARGRLYTKHTELFKYVGDSEDSKFSFVSHS